MYGDRTATAAQPTSAATPRAALPDQRVRSSLRSRLAIGISVLLLVLGASFAGAAYWEARRVLLVAGGDRLTGAGRQLSSLLAQSAANRIAETQRLAGDPSVGACLSNPTMEGCRPARAVLQAYADRNTGISVALRDTTGKTVLAVASSSGQPPATDVSTRPVEGFGPFVTNGKQTTYEIAAPVRQVPGKDVTYVVVRRALAAASAGDLLGRLIGGGVRIKVGDASRGVWTDLSSVVPAPPRHDSSGQLLKYWAEGAAYLGTAADVRGTPWQVWVEVPEGAVLAPARNILRQMLPVTLFIVIAGAVFVGVLTRRITTPLSRMTDAAEAIAAGDFSRRVASGRRDEIGRLAGAFNAMTAHVEEAQHRLEARVAERTAELVAARHEADRANRAKSEFLSLMSHDLRTPLNAILGFAQLLEIDNLNADQAEHVRQILSGGRHLLELISEVLDITRVESGRLSLSTEPVSVREVVQRAVELVQPLAAQRSISLNVQSVPADHTVQADRQRLSQILLNLLSNAVKYNRPDGRVTIGCERISPNRYRIAVTDTGAGIPESKVKLLFQPFERLGAEQTAIEGTGLGLALARALAEAMGGTLGVTSVVDRGSTFWVELAEAEHPAEHAPGASPTQASVHTAPTRGGVILYIEDNLSNVRLMERILRQRPGVQLLHAPHGEAGFARIRERRPDLVFLDLHLPDMSGEDVLRHLWADPASRSIPVVVVTADATPGLARRLKAAGATACLTKPLNVKEVVQTVDSILSEHPQAGADV